MANAQHDGESPATINTASVPISGQQSAISAATTATYDFANTTTTTPSTTRRTSIASVGMSNENSSSSQPQPPSDGAAASSTTASASMLSSQVSEGTARRPRIKDYGETTRLTNNILRKFSTTATDFTVLVLFLLQAVLHHQYDPLVHHQ
jgi:cystathionine beta-lyase/cystathionine gamma-synthase